MEDIKRDQETLSYASSKVDYSVGGNLYMLPRTEKLTQVLSGTIIKFSYLMGILIWGKMLRLT